MTHPRLVGINHVALEVADLEEALLFWRGLCDIGEPEQEPGAAFVDLGDQFLTLIDRRQAGELETHFGLVVDNKSAMRHALAKAAVEVLPGPRLDFHDPFGNRIQVVQYDEIQFTKTRPVLAGMGLDLRKRPEALAELWAKGLV